ncbi:MAG: HAD family phosphatase [Clostridium sp.]|nr:HAD family phosphatase [Clostridium sp.]
MKKSIKNIVFDFGGVIVDLDKTRVVEAFRQLGVDAETYVGRYAQSGPFQRLELGETDVPAFCEELRRSTVDLAGDERVREALTDENICQAWNRMLVGIPRRRIEALKRLREHYRLFMLSNTNDIHWDYSVGSLFGQGEESADFLFEKVFLSQRMHLAKPSPFIFTEMMRLAGISPDETLYIDDSEENCKAARNLGLHTFVPEEADDWLPLFIG